MVETRQNLPSDPDRAWDELYEAEPQLPPRPVSPKRRRFRRLVWRSLLGVVLLVGAAGGVGYFAVMQVAQMLRAVSTGDAAYLETHVNWPELQQGLRTDLLQLAQDAQTRSLGAGAPAVATQAYLSRLADTTVSAERQPAKLSHVVLGRVFSGERFWARVADRTLVDEGGGVHLLGGGGVRLDFDRDPLAFPSGISLCLRLRPTDSAWLQMFRLGWPESGRRC
jgi:hypothetical protein